MVDFYSATAADLTNPARGRQVTAGFGTSLPFRNLARGDRYRLTVTVTATSRVGTGAASAPSNVVTP